MEETKLEENETCHLTPQQFNVLKLLTLGLQNKEIADRMGLAVSTVKLHVSGILRRLNVRTRTAAVIKAQKQGLIDIDKE